jgi:hypothetical protein
MKYFLAAGGLGNQLFIWNAAHIAQKVSGDQVRIIYPRGNNLADRENELNNLAKHCTHQIQIRNSSTIFSLIRIVDRINHKSKIAGKIFSFIFRIYKSENPEEEIPTYKIRRKKIFVGYFQNSKQVLETFENIRAELLKIESEILAMHSSLVITLAENRFTGIHIRRGDYLKNANSLGILAESYYTPIKESKNLLISIEYKSDLKMNPTNAIVISGEEFSPWESFFILSLCSEIWIANSTFSWWVGSFARNKNAIVVAPDPWNLVPMNSTSYLKNSDFQYKQSIFEADI